MEPSVIEISTPRFLRSWSVVVHRVTAGETQEAVTKKRGIPLTGVDQTLFDLGGVIPLHHLEVVFDDALNRRLTTLPSLESTVNAQARSGKLGSGALRKLIESRSELAAIPESALETKLLGLLQAAHVPLPISQYEIRDAGRFVARADFAYPDFRVVIEADGYQHHSSRNAWNGDRQRRNRLTTAGWSVLHVTWRDLERRPQQLVHDVRQILSLSGAG